MGMEAQLQMLSIIAEYSEIETIINRKPRQL